MVRSTKGMQMRFVHGNRVLCGSDCAGRAGEGRAGTRGQREGQQTFLSSALSPATFHERIFVAPEPRGGRRSPGP